MPFLTLAFCGAALALAATTGCTSRAVPSNFPSQSAASAGAASAEPARVTASLEAHADVRAASQGAKGGHGESATAPEHHEGHHHGH